MGSEVKRMLREADSDLNDPRNICIKQPGVGAAVVVGAGGNQLTPRKLRIWVCLHVAVAYMRNI